MTEHTDAAADWAARHPSVSGMVLEQPLALAAGIAEFATMLEQPSLGWPTRVGLVHAGCRHATRARG